VSAYRVTHAARRDFKAVLKETREQFGPQQQEVCRHLIAEAVRLVAAEPGRAGSWNRGVVVPGLRAFHLEHAARRRGAAAHILYYAVECLPDGASRVVILRLLHERMEPKRHLGGV
jgi:toxin ParE1/3/4